MKDDDGTPVDHPGIGQLFGDFKDGRYRLHRSLKH